MTAQPVTLRHHGQNVHRIEQPAGEAIFAGRHEGDINVAARQAVRQTGTTVLNQMDFDDAVAPREGRQAFHFEDAVDFTRWGDWGLALKVAAPFGMLERGLC